MRVEERNPRFYQESMKKADKYIPALGFHSLTRLYDALIKCFMPESGFKRRLVNQAKIRKNDRILDLGCGTGTLTILIKQLYPDTEVFGVDADEKVLQIAEEKAAKAGAHLRLNQGMAIQLPYQDHSFQRVLSSLVIHHLTTEQLV